MKKDISRKSKITDSQINMSKWLANQAEIANQNGKTAVYSTKYKNILGTIFLVEVIRDKSKDAATVLQKTVNHIARLNGKSKVLAVWVAIVLAIEMYFVEKLPEHNVTASVEPASSGIRRVTILNQQSKARYVNMVQNLGWAMGYNSSAIPLDDGSTDTLGFVLSPNAQFLKRLLLSKGEA